LARFRWCFAGSSPWPLPHSWIGLTGDTPSAAEFGEHFGVGIGLGAAAAREVHAGEGEAAEAVEVVAEKSAGQGNDAVRDVFRLDRPTGGVVDAPVIADEGFEFGFGERVGGGVHESGGECAVEV